MDFLAFTTAVIFKIDTKLDIWEFALVTAIIGVYFTPQYRFSLGFFATWPEQLCAINVSVCLCLLVCSRTILLKHTIYCINKKVHSDFITSALGSKHIAINMNLMIESLKCNWIECCIHMAYTLLIYMRACGEPQPLYVLISIFHFTPFTENLDGVRLNIILRIGQTITCYRGQTEQVSQFFFYLADDVDADDNHLECENYNIVWTLNVSYWHTVDPTISMTSQHELMPCCFR